MAEKKATINPTNNDNNCFQHVLTLIWVGFLGVRFEVKGGGVKITPYLKSVRFMLETSNLARKYTLIFTSRKYSF